MSVKYVDIEYLRAQNASQGQMILAGQSNTLTYTSFVTVDTNGNVSVSGNMIVTGSVVSSSTSTGLIRFSDNTTQNTASINRPSYGDAGTVQFAGPGNVFSGSSSLFWDSGNLRLGIGTNTPVTTLQIKSTAIESTSNSWSDTETKVLDSFSIIYVRSAHYFVQVTDEDNSRYHISQITVVHDGLMAYKSEYNIVVSYEKLGEFDCRIQGGQLQLTFTAYEATNKIVKITRTSMTA